MITKDEVVVKIDSLMKSCGAVADIERNRKIIIDITNAIAELEKARIRYFKSKN